MFRESNARETQYVKKKKGVSRMHWLQAEVRKVGECTLRTHDTDRPLDVAEQLPAHLLGDKK